MSNRGQLIIVGAGVFGSEVLSWFEDIPEADRAYEFKGFLDDNPNAAERGDLYLGTIDGYEPSEGDVFICSIGSTRARFEVCRRLEEKGWTFGTIVHPTARVDRTVTVSPGSIIAPFVYIGPGAKMGKHLILNVQATVGHDTVIGDACTLSSHTDLTGQAVLENGVYVGSHASVLQKVRVGEFATVGAGSVAVRAVKPNSTVFGLPAKVIS